MTSATFCDVSIIFFMSITLFWFVLYICQVLLATNKYNSRYWGGRGLIQPPPPGPEEPLKSPVHIGFINLLKQSSVGTLLLVGTIVYCFFFSINHLFSYSIYLFFFNLSFYLSYIYRKQPLTSYLCSDSNRCYGLPEWIRKYVFIT